MLLFACYVMQLSGRYTSSNYSCAVCVLTGCLCINGISFILDNSAYKEALCLPAVIPNKQTTAHIIKLLGNIFGVKIRTFCYNN